MRSIAIRCWHCAVRSITGPSIRCLRVINSVYGKHKNHRMLPTRSHQYCSQTRASLKVKYIAVQSITLMARQPPALIFMEACGGAHDWARRFRAMGHEVRLLAPQYVTPFRRGQKNDPNDALALTEAGQRPNIPTVPIKTIAQQDLQGLHRVRERLVKHRTAVVNQVRGLLLEYGIVIPQGIARLRKRLPRVLEEADNGLFFP